MRAYCTPYHPMFTRASWLPGSAVSLWSTHPQVLLSPWKSHPLEGSRQEAKPLPSTTFDIFSRCVLLGTLHPRLAISNAAVFSLSWRRLLCAAPVTHQDQGLLMSRCCARHLPLASSCPRKPSVPYRVQFCTAYRSHGSLTGPTLTGLTAEASHHSAMRWQALCD